MEIRQLFLFALLSITVIGSVSSQDDYYEYEEYEDDGEYIYEEYEYEYDEDCDDPDGDGICGTEGEEYEDRPMFGDGDSTLVRVDMGNTARLTCTVHGLGSRVISWKRGENFITLGKSLTVDDKRMSVTLDQSSSTLTIALVKEQDTGDYACTVSTAEEPISRTFTIEIKAPPHVKIIGKPPGGEISKKAGAAVALTCQGEGDPKPQLKWKKLNSKFVMPGARLELSSITISEAGTYQCIADNGFGQPAVDSVKLSVKHKPVVFVDEEYLRDEETQEIKYLKLTCLVQAFPAATAEWTRSDQELKLPQERMELKKEDGKHVLEIWKPVQTDLGVYTCKATNSEGTMFAVLTNKEMASLPPSAAPQLMAEKVSIPTPSGSDKLFCPVVTTAFALVLTCLVRSL